MARAGAAPALRQTRGSRGARSPLCSAGPAHDGRFPSGGVTRSSPEGRGKAGWGGRVLFPCSSPPSAPLPMRSRRAAEAMVATAHEREVVSTTCPEGKAGLERGSGPRSRGVAPPPLVAVVARGVAPPLPATPSLGFRPPVLDRSVDWSGRAGPNRAGPLPGLVVAQIAGRPILARLSQDTREHMLEGRPIGPIYWA